MPSLLEPPLALLAGLFTVASRCVLSVMPILLGAGAECAGRVRLLFIVAGFSVAFATLALTLGAMPSAVHVAQHAVRDAATALPALFGLLRLWPGLSTDFGVLVIITAAAIGFQYDTLALSVLSAHLPTFTAL
ncbi:hypothetical protein [Burkholderia sp. TSV86]|uniref:hypothetical protein n=1 Tax=Burkholderia sp. TSV86 TaxID=1385594 RepID=UPI000A3F831F|nr:hypothetical protein [Burkholderia sp. TSV86]